MRRICSGDAPDDAMRKHSIRRTNGKYFDHQMGQTTAFAPTTLKPTTTILGTNTVDGAVRYIHGTQGKGYWTFYGGHDPEDYQHRVGDPPTDLNNHPNSPGYRLILNNNLFPAAKKPPQKT